MQLAYEELHALGVSAAGDECALWSTTRLARVSNADALVVR